MVLSTGYFKFIALLFSIIFTFSTLTSLSAVSVMSQAGEEDSEKPSVSTTQNSGEFSGKSHYQRKKTKIPYKDPRLACLMSFIIPGGGGHFYLRNDIKGVTFCVGLTLGYAAALFYMYSGTLGGKGKSSLIIGGLVGLISIVIHVVSMVEAYNDAVKINEARFYRDY